MNMQYSTFTKEYRLNDLAQATQFCTLCERMTHRAKILSDANGIIDAKVLFIAEAPGRLGADRTGVPLHGDRTGDNFEALLGNIGWNRDDIFITNAILCNPRKGNGTNGTPTSKEIRNCCSYLEMIINLVDPHVVVTLGRVALEALSYVQPHNYSLAKHVSKAQNWAGKVLIPLYHPAPRAMVHRSFAKQTSDYIALAKFVDPVKGTIITKKKKFVIKKSESKIKFHNVQKVINALLDSVKEMSYFKLVKLLYFVDFLSIERYGMSVTGEIYIRQQEGPWLPKIRTYLTLMDGKELDLFIKQGRPFIRRGHKPRLMIALNEKDLEIIADVMTKYGHLSNSELKTAAYLSKPMRYILREERKGRKMRNAAVIYKNKTIINLDTEK